MNLKKYIIIMFVAVCVFGCACSRSQYAEDLTVIPESTDPGEDAEDSGPIVSDSTADKEIIIEDTAVVTVYICGEVVKAGVYTLPAGARIVDAVEAAGGFTGEACETCVNLADILYDGEMIDILSEDEMSSGMAGVSPPQDSVRNAHADDPSGGLININTADAGDLMTLPGIGESKANAIISYRQEHGFFTSIEDIMKIDGIKEGIFNNIKDYITV